MFKKTAKSPEKYAVDEPIETQHEQSTIQQNDIENIDPEGEAQEIEPIDIEEVQKIQAELPPPDMDAPVGSNKNPIRIIQQGSQYITTQDVSSDHLEQIIQVLTNQALLDGSTGRPNAIYNKNTNKRIIFRVIKRKRKRAGEESAASQSVRSIKHKHMDRDLINESRERKRYRKDSLSSESEEDPDFEPDMPEEEILPFPLVRKKTVSGRISRPPRHLITDYKHLKKEHLEKPDTSSNDSSSDAGYSDFEHGAISDKDDQEEKLKEFSCDICGLEFTTKAGLSRHRGCKHPEAGSGPGYRVGRYTNAQSALIKRRKRLQDALDEATDEDLIELVAPRMSRIISPWDNILMRSEPDDLHLPHVSSLVFEFFSLAEQARAFITAHLETYTEPKKDRPGPKSMKQKQADDGEEAQETGESATPCILRIDTEEQAGSLGLTVGRYLVKQPLKEDLLPDRFKAILLAQRQLADKMAEKRAGIDSGDEEGFANVGYEDEPTPRAAVSTGKRGPGRPPGSGVKKQQTGKRDDISEKYSAKKAAPITKTSIEQNNQGSAEPQILERVHDPTLNDDLVSFSFLPF
ncbi:hypothetical protein Ciccas_000034 [Cichlidogyrus casuarinus]|uniref:C2H2-type domain-containing protein n=1 Tax=Cichlidogyrus casuarinus TaxID=1844966 RepID=A0ABD2QP21_9PLAT